MFFFYNLIHKCRHVSSICMSLKGVTGKNAYETFSMFEIVSSYRKRFMRGIRQRSKDLLLLR